MTRSNTVTIILAITFWWVWMITVLTPPAQEPLIPWAVDNPMGIYLNDPFQFEADLKRNEEEIQQAKEFFSVPFRDPTRQIVLQRNTI
jgi:hypothetical protein